MTLPDPASRDETIVADIVRAADLARQFAAGLDHDRFLDDLKTQPAVLHELMVVGEAVKRLSDEFRAARPRIPWRLIAGMRDRLIHQYDAVDLDEVWKTVTVDLPYLVAELNT